MLCTEAVITNKKQLRLKHILFARSKQHLLPVTED